MEAHKVDSRLIYELGRSADAAEGVSAFLEKRPARFPMRPSADLPDALALVGAAAVRLTALASMQRRPDLRHSR